MLNLKSRQEGFTLVELMIGLVILAILLSTGLPAFSLWIQNTQTRTGAESILNGLQLARTEAVTRNANVRFTVTSTGGTVDWNVGCTTAVGDVNLDLVDDCPAAIQSRSGAEGSRNARVGISTAGPGVFGTAIASGTGLPAGVTFNFLGRVVNPDPVNPGLPITRIDVTNATTTNARRMVITIGTGGTIRMCDPDINLVGKTQGCS